MKPWSLIARQGEREDHWPPVFSMLATDVASPPVGTGDPTRAWRLTVESNVLTRRANVVLRPADVSRYHDEPNKMVTYAGEDGEAAGVTKDPWISTRGEENGTPPVVAGYNCRFRTTPAAPPPKVSRDIASVMLLSV